VNALPEPHGIVIQFVVGTTQFLVDDDVLIALLLGFGDGIMNVDIDGAVALQEVLLRVLDDAVWTQRHQAVGVAAEVGQ
jgi:hypothetical protein